nr:MAG TPA: hypothetical protein [Caudoviricetes sp.]
MLIKLAYEITIRQLDRIVNNFYPTFWYFFRVL